MACHHSSLSPGKGRRLAAGAFSIVELLVVIAVIGILASVGLAAISNIDESANIAKDQRNAQTVVTIFSTAKAAGLDFEGNNLAQTVQNIVAGGTVSEGTLAGAHFGLSSLTPQSQTRVRKYLDLKDGRLEYLPEGN